MAQAVHVHKLKEQDESGELLYCHTSKGKKKKKPFPAGKSPGTGKDASDCPDTLDWL